MTKIGQKNNTFYYSIERLPQHCFLIPDVLCGTAEDNRWEGDESANYGHEKNKSGLRLKFNEESGWPQVCVHF